MNLVSVKSSKFNQRLKSIITSLISVPVSISDKLSLIVAIDQSTGLSFIFYDMPTSFAPSQLFVRAVYMINM